jgi:ABC-type multidrug transport system ATPase subunit
MDEPIIEVKNLSKKFGTFEAVKDVSFTVNKGDVFGFLGPNGAGKSTTIRCMLSLIAPNSGTIAIFGKNLANHRTQILNNIGCIIEKPDFYRYLSAEKNLEMFARISGRDSSKKEIQEMLEFVGLSGRGKDKVKGFSHGMKQRLGIAQTLLHKPDLIILDEPTTGLDPQGIIEVRNLILRLKTEQQKTVLLSSHQLSEIEIIANRMVIINKGKSMIEGSVDALVNEQDLLLQINVSDYQNAMQAIELEFPTLQVKHLHGSIIEMALEKEMVPTINYFLVNKGFSIHSLEPKRKLEDFFMKIIQE